MAPGSPRVLIYAPHLLPVSQPWVRQHAQLLPRFQTAVAGRRRAHPTLDLGGTPSFCIADAPAGAPRAAAFLLSGRSPRLEAFIRRFQPDLIHAHFAPGATEVMDIAARCRLPLVVSYHGWDAHIDAATRRPYDRQHLRRRRRLFDQAALVLTASGALRDRVVALGSDPDRTEVHYLGIDRSLFDGARHDDGARRIAMIGRLVRSKGTHFAIEALRLLLPRLPDAELAIVGDGPERPRLERQAAGLPVTFLGAGTQADARDLLARSRVHCLPSTTSEALPPETLGLAAAEAQAMGVPVVATATGGIPEVVRDGATGLLVPDARPDALAAALERLLTDDGLHARLSAEGRAHVARTLRRPHQSRAARRALRDPARPRLDRISARSPRPRRPEAGTEP